MRFTSLPRECSGRIWTVWPRMTTVAREYLVAGYDQRRLTPAITLDYLLGMLAQHAVEVDLR